MLLTTKTLKSCDTTAVTRWSEGVWSSPGVSCKGVRGGRQTDRHIPTNHSYQRKTANRVPFSFQSPLGNFRLPKMLYAKGNNWRVITKYASVWNGIDLTDWQTTNQVLKSFSSRKHDTWWQSLHAAHSRLPILLLCRYAETRTRKTRCKGLTHLVPLEQFKFSV